MFVLKCCRSPFFRLQHMASNAMMWESCLVSSATSLFPSQTYGSVKIGSLWLENKSKSSETFSSVVISVEKLARWGTAWDFWQAAEHFHYLLRVSGFLMMTSNQVHTSVQYHTELSFATLLRAHVLQVHSARALVSWSMWNSSFCFSVWWVPMR